jgi:hypothetical protein
LIAFRTEIERSWSIEPLSLALDEAGSERHYHLDLPSLERAIAMTGRTAESVRAQNPAPRSIPAPHRTVENLDHDLAKAISADIGVNILDNLNRLQNPSNGLLPHVRSDIKDYLKDGKYGIQSLYVDDEARLGGDFYGRLTSGLLEEMSGGADIPIDPATPFPSRSTIGTVYRPLTRDGGQLLNSPRQLYWQTRGVSTQKPFRTVGAT